MAKGSFGERLKRERELREVTLEEITAATRISSRFLEALENEEWNRLPGGVFNRGFVRSVARYLGLDEEAFLGEYDLAHGTQAAFAPPPPEKRFSAGSKWIPFLLFIGLLFLLFCAAVGGVYAWRYYAARRAQNQSMASTPAAVSSPLAPTLNSPASALEQDAPSTVQEPPLDLLVSASAATRVRIVADGQLLFEGEILSGENRHFHATSEFEVTAADSSAVLLELNGQAMPPLGAPGASGTMTLGRKDLRQASGGNSQP
jgi:cytoskeleton protein RodZ